jgi:hypothetical protein
MAKHTLFCVPGTSEVVDAADSRPEITPAAEVGMLTGVTNLLDRRAFDIWQIIPGWTALRHSANHLNFWGPRLPDFVDVVSAA